MLNNFFFHIRPAKIQAEALRFRLTYGLGGAAALMVSLQLFTGLLLNFAYEPVPVQAYLSVQHISSDLLLGPLIRNLHHWTGHFLVIVLWLHLLRVFFSNAYFSPRCRTWYSGLFLLLLVLMANFTGYLLPWDQLAFWAVTIAASMLSYIPVIGSPLQTLILGGSEVSGATLHVFYSFHTMLLPTMFLIAMSYHFWRIRKSGGVLLEKKSRRKMLPVVPDLLVRECAFMAVVSCFLMLFAMSFDAPLTGMANPVMTPETVKAPWYFLWLQELLLHMQPVLAMCVPLAFALFLLLLPLWGRKTARSPRAVQLLMLGFLLVITGLTFTGFFFRGSGMQLVLPW